MGVDYPLLERMLLAANRETPGLIQSARERLCLHEPELEALGWTGVLDELLAYLLAIPQRRPPAWMAAELPRAGARFQRLGLAAQALGPASKALREVLAETVDEPWTQAAEVQWTATIALAGAMLLAGYR